MERLTSAFWHGKKVLITGHTGFKGTWLTFWLQKMNAQVHGYADTIPTRPSLFKVLNMKVPTTWGDIRDIRKLKKCLRSFQPEIIFHLAAQPLVRTSYETPLETFATNTIGTANLLEAVRECPSVKAAVLITTDKVYLNREKDHAFRETDPLGGYDPYSASKAAAEIVIASYRDSFFAPNAHKREQRTLIASARAGNVIGGGDFAVDRLIPDLIRALMSGKELLIRNPKAIRPWQFVLEPLHGYLLLAESLFKGTKEHASAFNFGPDKKDARPVEWIARMLCKKWADTLTYTVTRGPHPHEAHFLKLDCTKAKKILGWRPVWDLPAALNKVVEWTQAYQQKKDMRKVCNDQIDEYMEQLS